MSNVSAAIGLGQLKVLDKRVNRRREIFGLYKNGFSKNASIKLMPAFSSDSFSNCWLSSINLSDSLKVIPLIEYLEKFNIETRPLWKPMHLQPFYEKYNFIGNQTSDNLFNHGLCLPSDSKLLTLDIEFVIKKVNEFFDL
jgi:dTDP-4-amino-4,6-dideoxygalactose transaminase